MPTISTSLFFKWLETTNVPGEATQLLPIFGKTLQAQRHDQGGILPPRKITLTSPGVMIFGKIAEKNGETNIWLSRSEMEGNFGRCLMILMFVSFLGLVWQPGFVGFSAPEIISGKVFFRQGNQQGLAGWPNPTISSVKNRWLFEIHPSKNLTFKKEQLSEESITKVRVRMCFFFCKFPLPLQYRFEVLPKFVDFGRCLGQWGMPLQTFGPFFTMWMTSAEEIWMGKHGLQKLDDEQKKRLV